MNIKATCGSMKFEGDASTRLPYDSDGDFRQGIEDHNNEERQTLEKAFENWCDAVKACGGVNLKVKRGG